MSKKQIKAIDFFCGSGGMTYGMHKAGIHVLAGLDIDESCRETYEHNNKYSKFIAADIKNLTFEELEKETGITKNDENLLFIGCSPCQYWSIIRTKRDKASETKNLLGDFKKFADYFKPGYIVIENVPGIRSKRNESGVESFLKFLRDNEYYYDCDILNAYEYGVPQTRKRFVLIASRLKDIKLPPKTNNKKVNVGDFIGVHNGFPKVKAGNRDDTSFLHTVAGLEDKNKKRLSITPKNGGTRASWAIDEELQIETYKKHTGFYDVYGRMHWDKPAPTITTKFFSLSNGRFGHPDELRAISLREGATLQTFPKTYKFKLNSIAGNARLIGNAVPPILAEAIGKQILEKN